MVEAFTPAEPDRKLQALFLALFVLPQIAVFFAASADLSVYTEMRGFLGSILSFRNWQRWMHDEAFVFVLFLWSFERLVYTLVWLVPQHFIHFAKTGPLRSLGAPLDVILALFYTAKALQFGSIGVWYAWVAAPVSPSSISLFRWVTGLTCLGVGQLLNTSIYNAIGKAGVYYGFKIGIDVPWCTSFPFNVFTMHPQYAGCVLTLVGAGFLLCTEAHADAGFMGIGFVACLYYVYMSIIEDIPGTHPADEHRPGSPSKPKPEKRFRDLRKLKWTTFRSAEFETSANILGLMARPWFPTFLAVAYAANCFVMVLPFGAVYCISCFRDSLSVLPVATASASGAALGVACLITVLQSGSADDFGLMSVADINRTWPKTVEWVPQNGLSGAFASLIVVHPLPVVVAALDSGFSVAPLVLVSWFGTFTGLALVGLTCAVVKKVGKAVYASLFGSMPAPAKSGAGKTE